MDNDSEQKKKQMHQDLRQTLAENNACFVLITCGQPSEDGKMQVEMISEGDPSLAAYLIESAYGLLENQEEAMES